MFFLILFISPIPINAQSPFLIEIQRYSIVYTISPSNSTPSLPAYSEIYFDHQEKKHLTNTYTSKNNFSITNKTNKTFISSFIFNQIIYITTAPKFISNHNIKNTWKKSGNYYRYKTLERTHLSNTFFQILTNNKQIITNTSIIFTANKNNTVKSGLWYDHFTDSYITNTSLLQIDHVVSFADAFRSHTNNWSKKNIKDFFNTNINSGLLPIHSNENQKKSDNTPSKYVPPNINFQSIYIDMYVNTKKHYNLKLKIEETNNIANIIKMPTKTKKEEI